MAKLSNERVEELDELDKGCSHCCETEWAFACACTVASLENEWTCSWKVDLSSVNHSCLVAWNRFL